MHIYNELFLKYSLNLNYLYDIKLSIFTLWSPFSYYSHTTEIDKYIGYIWLFNLKLLDCDHNSVV